MSDEYSEDEPQMPPILAALFGGGRPETPEEQEQATMFTLIESTWKRGISDSFSERELFIMYVLLLKCGGTKDVANSIMYGQISTALSIRFGIDINDQETMKRLAIELSGEL